MAWEQLYANGSTRCGTPNLTNQEDHRLWSGTRRVDGLRPSQLAERLELSKQATHDVLRDFGQWASFAWSAIPPMAGPRIVRFTERGWRCYEAACGMSRRVGERWAAQIGEERYRAMSSPDCKPSLGFDGDGA